MTPTPRVLFVGRTRYRLPLPPGLARKWDALAGRMEVRVLASAVDGRTHDDGVFRLARRLPVLDGPLFYLLLPLRVARELRSFHPDVIVAESPYEAAFVRLGRTRAKLVVEIHGDWHTSTRMYGSRVRRTLVPLGDRIADRAVRSADAVRAISAFTASLVRALGREPAATFPTYFDVEAFLRPLEPLPEKPRLLFVGVLERSKNVEVLAAAWRAASQRAVEATLHLVGTGSREEAAEALVRAGAEWDRRLEPAGVARALDASTALLLPSATEGLGRVAIEALLRGRPVIGTRVGGIPDIVEDGVNGLLVEPGDAHGLAAAIERLATDRALAERLAEGARASAPAWATTPDEYAERVRALVDATLAKDRR